MLNERVELSLGGSLFLVALPGDSDSDSVGEVADALGPDELVEFGVDSDIGSAHHLGNPFLDFIDGFGSLALELGAMGQLVDVDGCIDGCLGQSCSLFFLHHNITN